MGADLLEIVRDLADRLDVEPGVAIGLTQCLDDRAQGGLRGVAREAVHRRVDRIDARRRGREHGRNRSTRGVMRVEMDR